MKKHLMVSLFGFSALLLLSFLFLYAPRNAKKSWMSKQVQEDLSLYTKEELNPYSLRHYFSSSSPSQFLIYYQIKEGKLYFKKNWDSNESFDRFKKTTKLLNRLVSKNKLPDMEWILTVHDGVRQPLHPQNKLPLFCYAKTKGGEGILFPDPLTEDFARKGRKAMWRSQWRAKYQWKNKKDVAFWRGGTTGDASGSHKAYDAQTWYKQPRTHLALLSQYHPQKIDAGFVSYPGVEPKVLRCMTQHLPFVKWTTHKDHLQYKYLVIPDGNTCTYPRYYLALYSNSVAFKQQSDQIQWFYKPLKANVHYVEVAHDFSNLPELVQDARAQDREMKKISKRAHRWVCQNLMPRHIEAFVKELLLQYAHKQQAPASPLLEGAITYEEFKRSPS